jgi:hypothetical protein
VQNEHRRDWLVKVVRVVEILWILRKKMDMSPICEMWLFLLVFLLAEHLDLNQITVGSKADVHMMTGRTGISSELLLTWTCMAKVYDL